MPASPLCVWQEVVQSWKAAMLSAPVTFELLDYFPTVLPRAITLRESLVQTAVTVARTTVQRCMDIAFVKAMLMTMCTLCFGVMLES